MKKRLFFIIVTILLMGTAALSIFLYFKRDYHWPSYPKENEYIDFVKDFKQNYLSKNFDYTLRVVDDYSFNGSYFNYGTTKTFTASSDMKLDKYGIPMVQEGDKYIYNPVTIEQFALTMHGKYILNKVDKEEFIKAADKLIDIQNDDGSYRYDYEWRYYLLEDKLQPGWVSGMAQGQALSVFARAYHITKDKKYIKAAESALNFLLKPVSEGGCTDTLEHLDESLEEYIIFEEYICEPASYTLNGFMFTLLGLYDWSETNVEGSSDKIAKKNFRKGIKTLKHILPYYDIGGFTVYDLSYITFEGNEPADAGSYHAVHIQQLHILSEITGDKSLKKYEKLWTSYIEN